MNNGKAPGNMRSPSGPAQRPASSPAAVKRTVHPPAPRPASAPAGRTRQTHAPRPASAPAAVKRTNQPPVHRPRPASAVRPAPVRPGTRPNTGKSRKHLPVLYIVFLATILITAALIIRQCTKSGSERDVLGYFETKAPAVSAPVSAESSDAPLITYAAYTDSTETLQIDCAKGILINLSDNTVTASKDGDVRMYPASMTKIMTLLVAYEHIENLDDTFTFDFKIVNDAYLDGASVAGFSIGETVPVRDLLYGSVLPSGADATTALAQYVAGDEAGFAALMNLKVEELGLKNTHFVTASGLHDENHYSTCHDIAKILEYAISYPYLREILSAYKYVTTPTTQHPEGITLYSTMYTRMKGDEAEGIYIQGGKTGFTLEGRHCLASFAARCTEERAPYAKPQYILVTAGGEGEYKPVYDAINTYEKYMK